jgi:transcriptional regulator with PAS, ATPase and Fis domain
MSVTEAPRAPRERTGRRAGFERIVTRSPDMYPVFNQAERAARSDATVLIRGESGTGKELFAEAIHWTSPRRAAPLVTINMAALPETLIESELFGHVAGAFTGAAAARKGRFEAAHGGTIFIDEIGDLGLASQAKLLRVLESHRVSPVGGNEYRNVDVRVIAATNRNLEAMIAEGEFREDLYYRLSVITISLPPLRRRQDDIPVLVGHFLEQLCRANGRAVPQLDPELSDFFESYDWPGNVRQLHNCIESMVVLSDGNRLGLSDLPAFVRRPSRQTDAVLQIPERLTLEEVERLVVLELLERFDGNRTRAAQALGISVRTLQRRLKDWNRDSSEAPI